MKVYVFQYGDTDHFAYSQDMTGANVASLDSCNVWLLRGMTADLESSVAADKVPRIVANIITKGFHRFAVETEVMKPSDLTGRSVLIVEDQPLIALDMANAFQEAGAIVTTTTSFRQAKMLIEYDGLSAVVLDHTLADGDSDALRQRLKARGIPFVIYSGYGELPGADAPVIEKPAKSMVVVETVARLLDGR